MHYYTIGKNDELSLVQLGKICAMWQTKELPRLKMLHNQYIGKHKILQKKATDTGKPNNQVIVNFCKQAVDTYSGYLLGNPIRYEGNESIRDIIDVNEYNDVHQCDELYLKNALIYGKSYCINYIDEDGKQRFRNLDPKECITILSDDLDQELEYVIRLTKTYEADMQQQYYVEVYGKREIKKYKSNSSFTSFELESVTPNYYRQCPITVFSLNDDETSIFEQIISLNDSYNELISGEIDSWDSFADAYLVIKGMNADEETLSDMKKHRTLLLDNDADANFLTHNLNDTQVVEISKNIDTKIHQLAAFPDFTDSAFGTASGIAIKYKILNFENVASSIEAQMKKAIQRRIELISSILKLSDTEEIWRTVKLIFTRNLPVDIVETASVIGQLKGTISDETLIAQLPFIENVQEEIERMKSQQQKNMELYQTNYSQYINE